MLPHLIFDPPFPPQHTVGLGLLLIAFAAIVYAIRSGAVERRRRAILGVLRCGLTACLAFILLRPMRPEAVNIRNTRPPFAVLVDTSASMDTRDMGGHSRYRTAIAALSRGNGNVLRNVAERCDVQVYEFGDTTVPTSLESLQTREAPDGLRTDIAQAMRAAGAQANREGDHEGILLVSDGRDNSTDNVRDAAMAMKTRGIPVWTVCVGTQTDVHDVYLTARLSQNFLFSEQPASLFADITHSGYEYRRVNVHLYRENQYVTTRQGTLKKGVTRFEFPIEEENKGLYKYHVTVGAFPDEADTRNNSRTVFARVVDEKTKILVVEAEPHWDSKFMVRAFQEDPNLNVTSVFYLSPLKVFSLREETSTETLEQRVAPTALYMPRTRDELFAYDCLVLGKGMNRVLDASDMGLLKEYLVERGGSILFFRGKSYQGDSELASFEPVTWAEDLLENVRLELTPEGTVSPVFSLGHSQPADVIVRSLPSLTSVTRIRGEKSLAVVLAVARSGATAEPMAAMSYQRYGKGKVMSIGASGLWRWALMAPEYSEYDDVHARLWRQLIHWLVFESDFLPGQDISFRTGAYTYVPGNRVTFRISTKHVDPKFYAPRVIVEPPEGAPFELEPVPVSEGSSVYAVAFTPEEEGEYKAVLRNNVGSPKQDSLRFTVYSDLVEKRLVASNPGLMSAVSDVTGAEAIALGELDTLPSRIRRHAEQSRRETDFTDAWPLRSVFIILVAWAALEWTLRKRWGLV